MATDPNPSRSELAARTTQEVARVEDEVVRVHETIAGQGGPD